MIVRGIRILYTIYVRNEVMEIMGSNPVRTWIFACTVCVVVVTDVM
jgi:hypothetical protein